MTLTVNCPTKVNLFLSVGPPDGTGYHPIRTVFQSVSLSEWVTIETGLSDEFVTIADKMSVPAENTVTKAWRLAREYVALPPMRVTLCKRVPPGSGLGAGSSDAGGFLRGLIRVTKGSFSHKEADEVARAVGSDVSFFLVGGCAQAEGYGADLRPLQDGPPKHLVITIPEVSVSTAEAYRRLDAVPREWKDLPEDRWALHNDFESVMPSECSDLKKQLLEAGASDAQLCGSGSGVFGVFESKAAADDAALGLKTNGVPFAEPCVTLFREESLWIS